MAHFVAMPLPSDGDVVVNVGRITYMRASKSTPGQTALYFGKDDTLIVKMNAQEIRDRIKH